MMILLTCILNKLKIDASVRLLSPNYLHGERYLMSTKSNLEVVFYPSMSSYGYVNYAPHMVFRAREIVPHPFPDAVFHPVR